MTWVVVPFSLIQEIQHSYLSSCRVYVKVTPTCFPCVGWIGCTGFMRDYHWWRREGERCNRKEESVSLKEAHNCGGDSRTRNPPVMKCFSLCVWRKQWHRQRNYKAISENIWEKGNIRLYEIDNWDEKEKRESCRCFPVKKRWKELD